MSVFIVRPGLIARPDSRCGAVWINAIKSLQVAGQAVAVEQAVPGPTIQADAVQRELEIGSILVVP